MNGGSSSIRFSVYGVGDSPQLLLKGMIDRIGSKDAKFTLLDAKGIRHAPSRIVAADHRAAVDKVFKWLEAQPLFDSIKGVGHRIVHGMGHTGPERVTQRLLAEFRRITPYDPDHLPVEIEMIEAVRRRHPKVLQVACFDTSFHRSMPLVARLLPIPWRYFEMGLERYGFHGLSYSFLMMELARLDGTESARGRVILAHLGSGASLAAVHKAKSIDTSMGFTPAGGLVMGTRSGDMDPGLLSFLAREETMSPVHFERMVNHESGLLGVSGRSSDMRDLLKNEARSKRVGNAVSLFCYQTKKWIGAYAAALGGLNTLVFSGGIGENAPQVRSRICRGLDFLGIELNPNENSKNAAIISTAGSRVRVRVIGTNEELMIARCVSRFLSARCDG